MFGFGKKKNDNEAAAPIVGTVAPAVPDERFTVMPAEYLSAAGAAPAAGGSKVFLIGTAGLLFLLALAGGLYWFLFARQAIPAPVAAPAVLPPLAATETTTEQAATTTAENLQVVESQAYDAVGQLVGAIKVSLPDIVANKYGQALGVAVLSPNDISLPAGSVIAGGIYSPYPVGATFDEPVNVTLTVASLGTAEARASYDPVFLKGTEWQIITQATSTSEGWAFSFDKFPAGPISIVERAPAAATTSASALSSAPAPSVDTDADGLTDEEEKLLGTNPALGDTDGDTYPDRAEIFGGYSPLAVGVKLEAADLFVTYTNPTYGYKAPYPKKWLADALDQTNKQVLFISATEEFFEILVEENPLEKPIVDWYRAQAPALANVQLDVTTVDGAAAVWSPDGLTLYIGRGGLVYIITYNKGTVEQINWPVLFEYFYKNFKFGNTATQTNNSAPAP